MIRTASLSRDRRHRYRLTRRWTDGQSIAWIMLNPSSADALHDDPTLRRCIAFSHAWGYAALTVVNLYTLRTAHPAELARATNPNRTRSNTHLRAAIRESDATIAAWGNLPASLAHATLRANFVGTLLPANALCLGLTQRGHPRHPLYVPGHTEPVSLAEASSLLLTLTLPNVSPTMSA